MSTNRGAGLRRRIVTVLAAASIAATSTIAQAQQLSFIRDTEIERLLTDYAQPIFRVAGLSSSKIAVRIVRADSFNAFVLDSHNIYVHTGTLQQSSTPNEVIGVIAHETGHIVGHHLAHLRERIARDQTKALLIRLLGIGVMVAGGLSGQRETTGAGTGLVLGGDELIMRSILADRRGQESAADQAGLRFLSATKQSGRGMLEVFERFANQELISATAGALDPFVRSHPVAANRIAQLRELVRRSPYYDKQDAKELQLRHDLVRAKLSGYLERPTVTFNRYPPSDHSLPARYGRAIATFFLSGEERSIPMVDALIKEQPHNPYFVELKADFLMRVGKPAEAVAPLRRALKLAGNAPLMQVQLAQALMSANGSVDEAMTLARRSLGSDPNPGAYRILANGYYKKNRLPEADLATAEALFLEGDVKQAQIFAKRALPRLKNGSPEWIRAGDIVNYKIQT